jgi:predicted nucleic acid-binding protein
VPVGKLRKRLSLPSESVLAERFVLDASVALAWFLRETPAATRYAAAVAALLAQEDVVCVVPAIFHIEVAATLIRKRRDRDAGFGKAKFEAALAHLTNLRIHTELTYYRVDSVALLADRYHVQGFDAVYLDLAARENTPRNDRSRIEKRSTTLEGSSLGGFDGRVSPVGGIPRQVLIQWGISRTTITPSAPSSARSNTASRCLAR